MTNEPGKHNDQVVPTVDVAESESASVARGGGPLNITFPCDITVWREARRLVTDRSVRVEDFATCTAQDPVIAIELLKTSNAMYFAGGRSPITTIKTAIVRLGYDVVLESLEKLAQRPSFEDEEVKHWFEVFRSKCKRTSIVCRILAEALARTLSDDCQSSGLLTYVGEMLAVAHFKEEYVKLTEEHSQGGINYYLSQKLRFDVEQMGLKYLRKAGIPEALLSAIDREAQVRNADRAILRPVCMAAAEMLEAFDANRWEKLAPSKTLPPKSNIRILQMNDQQYVKVYERVAEYLFLARTDEDRKRKAELQKTISSSMHIVEEFQGLEEVDEPEEEIQLEPEEDERHSQYVALNADIESLLKARTVEEPPEPAPMPEPVIEIGVERPDTAIFYNAFPTSLVEAFSLDTTQKKTTPRVGRPRAVAAAIPLRTSKGNAVVSSIADMFNSVKTSEQLLADLLDMLVKKGPFEKSAIIVVSRNRQYAIVVAARGPNIGNGQRLALNDPLSPLAQCFSKVQSFGNRENKASPFGSKTFALAPIDADHDTPVALYADCGNNGSLSFEARRIFRTVVGILNEKLPTLPGGIPIELNQ